MIKNADLVIIGGGIMGCSIAYQLAKRGWRRVALLEKRFLTSGSTGRCSAGIRQQWATEMNCRVVMGSLEIFRRFDEEIGPKKSIEFRERGYLLLAHSDNIAEEFKNNVKLQNSLGIPSKLLRPEDIKELMPLLNLDGVKVGSWCPTDGTANPFYTTFGFAEGAKRMGVKFYMETLVTGIETSKGKISGVKTNKGRINTPVLINAAGPYANEIGNMVGLNHPIEPERHQIAITEPVEKSVGTYIISLIDKSYIHQLSNGGILLGIADPHEPKGINYTHSLDFLFRVIQSSAKLIPSLKKLRIVRQWAGHADLSPDGQPILGPVPEVENYYLALGCGKGFQLSPMIGQLMAQLISGEDPSLPVNNLDIGRFARGELIIERAAMEGV